MSRAERLRFRGAIAGVGTTAGTRIVVGHWPRSPLGSFTDVMVESRGGHRVLLAPDEQVADFVAATYTFDEIRIEPVTATVDAAGWKVRSPSLAVTLTVGGRTGLGRLLRLVPRPLAEAPAWTALTDPVARLVLRGVRTRGTAGNARREWYGATDVHRITAVTGEYEGADLGTLTPVEPAPRFGFSGTPRTPSVTAVATTVEVPLGG